MFGLELLLIPLVIALTAPVALVTSAVVAAPAVMLSPLVPMVII